MKPRSLRLEPAALRGPGAPRRTAAEPEPPHPVRCAECEERYRTLYDHLPLMIFTLDGAGTVLSVNAYGARELGYEPGELSGKPVLELFHPEDRPAMRQELRAATDRPGEVTRQELRKVRKDGSVLWVREAVRAVREPGGELLVLAVCEDVTDRKRVERQLAEERDRLRAMSSALVLAEEGERRRIAAGLHDHVGQLLGVAKVELGQALAARPEAGVGDAADPKAAVAEGRRLVEVAIREIRSLTFDLSSPVLRDLGLESALRGLAERAEERHGLAFGFASDGPAEPAEGASLLLYSIVRELLWNVVKHAGARRGTLELAHDGEGLRITVGDDGVGFDAAGAGDSLTAETGLGLFSARQRLEQLGGGLEIESAPGEGTRVTLTLPLTAGGRRSGHEEMEP